MASSLTVIAMAPCLPQRHNFIYRNTAIGSQLSQLPHQLPAEMMGDPGLLQKTPEITILLPQGGGQREQ